MMTPRRAAARPLWSAGRQCQDDLGGFATLLSW